MSRITITKTVSGYNFPEIQYRIYKNSLLTFVLCLHTNEFKELGTDEGIQIRDGWGGYFDVFLDAYSGIEYRVFSNVGGVKEFWRHCHGILDENGEETWRLWHKQVKMLVNEAEKNHTILTDTELQEEESKIIKSKEEAKIIVLENLLRQAISNIEFLHGCLTRHDYKYAYPKTTLDFIEEANPFAPKLKGCYHSTRRSTCPACAEGDVYREKLEKAKEMLKS